MFINDNPILSSSEDRLKRSKFSKQFGKALLKLDHSGSIVIGLCGPWGSGKSSILNLALEEITKTNKDKKHIVFKFNPWNYVDQGNLISIFLTELAKEVRKTNLKEKARFALNSLSKKLIIYSQFLSLLVYVNQVSNLHPTLASMATFILSVKWIPQFIKDLAEAVKNKTEIKTKTLEELKNDINKRIKDIGLKITVVVDDIDRLSDEEIRQMFQLIKQSANFTSVTYILAFDDKQVAKVLDKSSFNGREYLEKIVQVHFQVPFLAQDLLESYFFEEMDKVIKPFPQKLWDNKHWGNLYYDGVQNFIKSIRHVKRFVNTLKFNVSLVPDEINPVDFIGIESLRVFVPEIYKEIGKNEDLFTETESSYSRSNSSEKDSKKVRLEKIIELGGEENKQTVTNIFRELFPQTESVLGNTSYGHEWQETWSEARRVCAKSRFKTYFFLDIPSGAISQSEINTLVKLSSNTKAIQKFIQGINKKGLTKKLLDRLSDFKNEIPLENVQSFLLGIFNESDTFPRELKGMFDEDSALKVNRVAYHLLKRIEDITLREKMFSDLLVNSKSLLAPVMLVSLEIPEDEKKDEEDKRLVRPEYRETLKKHAVQKIEVYAKSRKLDNVPEFARILYRWKEWGSLDKAKKYVAGLIKTDRGLISFIEGFMYQGSSQSMGDKISITSWKANTKAMEPFVASVDTIKKRVESFPNSFIAKLNKREKLVKDLFFESFTKKDRFDE